MSEMVERVVHALRKKAAEIDHRPEVVEADPMWFAEEYARVAIEAMREPTRAMVDIGEHWLDGANPTEAWRLMIDEALDPVLTESLP